MRITSLTRINDSDFLVKVDNHSEKIVIHCSKSLSLLHAHAIIKGTFEKLTEKQWNKFAAGKGLIVSNEKLYKLALHNKDSSLLTRISSSVIKQKIVPSRLEFDLQDFNMFELPDEDNQVLSKIDCQFKSDVLWKRDTSGLAIDDNKYCPLFSDVFSELSSTAMQRHIANFSQKDLPAESNPIIISCLMHTDPPIYVLIHKNDRDPNYSGHSQVVKAYYEQLKQVWGKEKVKDIELKYGIDLKLMIKNNKPLTPEIVQRFNIGLSTIETHDVKQFHRHLMTLRDDQRWATANPNLPIKEFAEIHKDFPLSFWIKLGSRYQTVGELRDHLSENNYFETPDIQKLKPAQFNELMNLVSLTTSSLARSYTGRKLEGFIDSSYTLAGVTEYKPWVDQQELNQCCENLTNNTSWEYFAEQMAYVACKKHLVHQNINHHYIVGTLIPAPVNEQGEARWYKVTGCINSGTGNLSYTLEPACNDPTLPVVKLFRSTASDPYNLDAAASVKSDFNPINSPGYEGRTLIEKYEAPFFYERTVPVWVASHYLARQKLDHVVDSMRDSGNPPSIETLTSIAADLNRAVNEMSSDVINRLRTRSLGEILSRYDHVILRVLPQIIHYFPYFLSNTIEKHTLNEQSPEKQIEDAKQIVRILDKYAPEESKELIHQLYSQIIVPADLMKIRMKYSMEFQDIYNKPCRELSEKFQTALEQNEKAEKLIKILNMQANIIQEYALATNEDISQKKQQGVLCIGHSLGGALASRTFGQYSLTSGRTAVPGKTMELYEFCAPGINLTDNAAFIQNGNKHVKTLQELSKPVKIHRRYAAGDFFPLGGQISLGGTLSRKEADAAALWLDFDAAVQTILPTASREELFAQPFIHGTQFEPKKPHGVIVQDTDNVARQCFDTYIQGAFNRSVEQNDEVMSHLNHIWKIDTYALKFAKFERRNAYLRALYRAEFCFKSPKVEESSHALHGNWLKHRDERGVFVVNESGVVSR